MNEWRWNSSRNSCKGKDWPSTLLPRNRSLMGPSTFRIKFPAIVWLSGYPLWNFNNEERGVFGCLRGPLRKGQQWPGRNCFPRHGKSIIDSSPPSQFQKFHGNFTIRDQMNNLITTWSDFARRVLRRSRKWNTIELLFWARHSDNEGRNKSETTFCEKFPEEELKYVLVILQTENLSYTRITWRHACSLRSTCNWGIIKINEITRRNHWTVFFSFVIWKQPKQYPWPGFQFYQMRYSSDRATYLRTKKSHEFPRNSEEKETIAKQFQIQLRSPWIFRIHYDW